MTTINATASPERTDTVNEGLSLIQRTSGLTYGTDALLLSAYIRGRAERAAELGSGTGIVSLLCLSKKKAAHIYAYEFQPVYARLSERNAAQNGMSDRLTALCMDIKDAAPDNIGGNVDLVFTNPPYMKAGAGLKSDTEEKDLARRESSAGIGEFCSAAARLLRFGGRFFCVYRPERLPELLCAMNDARLTPKRLTFVLPSSDLPPSLLLIEGRYGAGKELTVTRDLVIYRDKEHTRYTDDMTFLYENGNFPEKRYE